MIVANAKRPLLHLQIGKFVFSTHFITRLSSTVLVVVSRQGGNGSPETSTAPAVFFRSNNGPLPTLALIPPPITSPRGRRMSEQLWWFESMEMYDDFHRILYSAAAFFPDSELDNYPFMAEALWAQEKGL